jgi:hypothetical protein
MWAMWVASAWALQPGVERAEIFARADVVAIGWVADIGCAPAPSPRGEWPWLAWFTVLSATGAQSAQVAGGVDVTLRGGRCAGFEQIVEDEARLVADRRYALALVATDDGGWRVLGGSLGVVELRSPAAPFAPEVWP